MDARASEVDRQGRRHAQGLEVSRDEWSHRMRLAMDGDEAVYRGLLEDIGRLARNVARGLIRRSNVAEAMVEDIVQEALIAVHLGRHGWDPSRRLRPWVATIARRKTIDAMRRCRRRRFSTIEDLEGTLAAPNSEEPGARIDAERLIAALRPREQEIVRSISLRGETVAAVSRKMSMSEGAVRVALHRSIRTMAEIASSAQTRRALADIP